MSRASHSKVRKALLSLFDRKFIEGLTVDTGFLQPPSPTAAEPATVNQADGAGISDPHQPRQTLHPSPREGAGMSIGCVWISSAHVHSDSENRHDRPVPTRFRGPGDAHGTQG